MFRPTLWPPLLGPPSLTSLAGCRKWRNAQRQNQQQQPAAAALTATRALCSWKGSGWRGRVWPQITQIPVIAGSDRPGLCTHMHIHTLWCSYWPLQVLPSGCRVNPTGQLQRTPVAVSLHVLSQPPLFTAQVSAGGGRQAERGKEKEGDVNLWPLLLKHHEKETTHTEGDVGWDKASCSRRIHKQHSRTLCRLFLSFLKLHVALSTHRWRNYITTPQFSWWDILYRDKYSVHTHRKSQSELVFHWQKCIITTRQKHMTLCW